MNNPIEDLIREWIELERTWRETAKLALIQGSTHEYYHWQAKANTVNKCRVQLQEAVKKMEAEKTP